MRSAECVGTRSKGISNIFLNLILFIFLQKKKKNLLTEQSIMPANCESMILTPAQSCPAVYVLKGTIYFMCYDPAVKVY